MNNSIQYSQLFIYLFTDVYKLLKLFANGIVLKRSNLLHTQSI